MRQPSGHIWDREENDHRVRSEVTFNGTGGGRGKCGDQARHTLHVTPSDFIFTERILVVSACEGPCLSYPEEGKSISREKIGKGATEVLLFDYPVETNGVSPGTPYTETEQIHIEVQVQQLDGDEPEWITQFDLNLEIEFSPPPASPRP